VSHASSLKELQAECRLREDRGDRIVLTNGHFDLLHWGHVRYLRDARSLGDFLVVGLNGDASTRLHKGAGRPIIPEEERAALLLALECVDRVVIFQEPTASSLVQALQPSVYAKGGDWASQAGLQPHEPPEAPLVREYGGEVIFLPYLAGHSTSELIRRIQALPPQGQERSR
jgi:D-beta-D-heptose 7-phosphate kinase/D-beta-D-heptose 1-phosphate adenosyltransferase